MPIFESMSNIISHYINANPNYTKTSPHSSKIKQAAVNSDEYAGGRNAYAELVGM